MVDKRMMPKKEKMGLAQKLNPSVKACTVLAIVLILAFQYNTLLNITVLFASLIMLIFFTNTKKSSVFKILIPALLAAAGMFFMGLYFSRGGSVIEELGSSQGKTAVSYAVQTAAANNLGNALSLGSRILAYAGLGSFFVLSTDPEEFIRSLIHQMHLPVKFAYGILAAFHLVPEIRREYDKIKLAFCTRGVKVGGLSPKVIFVMLVNCIRQSDNVAMAMESKGFSGDEDRTYYSVPSVGPWDILFFALCTGGVILFIMLSK